MTRDEAKLMALLMLTGIALLLILNELIGMLNSILCGIDLRANPVAYDFWMNSCDNKIYSVRIDGICETRCLTVILG